MDKDLSWKEAREGWERLQWARRTWQSSRGGGSARDAALTLGMNENTYSAYERSPTGSKHTPLSHQMAIKFGRKFNVRWEWLLLGGGEPYLQEDDNSPRRRILKAIDDASEDDPKELERKADAIVTLLRVKSQS